MLYIINNLNDPLIEYIKDDPVRPEIPATLRIATNKEIFSIVDGDKPQAIVCVAYCDKIPTSVLELMTEAINPTHAIFYTIWSYVPGQGQALIRQVHNHLKTYRVDINRYVTLSPPTEMARKFHLRNGATVYKDNGSTVNYEYK